MKKYNASKTRVVLSVCLTIGVMALAVAGTLAIYTSQVYQRSVVRNRDNDVILFSSDKLYRVMEGASVQNYYYPMAENQTSMTFQVCNYDQSNNTLFSDKTIEYTVTVTVEKGTDGAVYIISCGEETKATVKNGNSVSFPDFLLDDGKRCANSYSVSFAEEDYNAVEITVKVIPNDLTITQNRILCGTLIPIEYATTQGVRANWEFTDSNRGKPDQFDAYNLLVSVSGGEGNVLISWDHTELDIDPFFASGKNVEKKGNESTITIPMNSEKESGTYLITFYNHNTTKPKWKEWTELPISVLLEETKAESPAP